MQISCYRICVRCIMDTSDQTITFDDEGVCNHCRTYEVIERESPPHADRARQLEALVARIKKAGRGSSYYCIVGMSGGVDSSYLAYLAISRGLRPLAVHVDGGWNFELAVKNIENVVKSLDIDLITFVVDWNEM